MSKSRYEQVWGVPESSEPTQKTKSRYEEVWGQPESKDESFYPSQEKMGAFNRATDVAGRFNKDVENAPGKLGNWVINKLNAAPREITGAISQTLTDPVRAFENVGLGSYNTAKGVANIPMAMRNYMAHLGLGNPENVKNTWHMPNEPILEGNMGEQQPGDKFIQGIPGILPFASPIKGAAIGTKNLITGAPKYAALAEKVGINSKSAATIAAEKAAQEAEMQHEQAQGLAGEAKENLGAAKEAATEEVGAASYPAMKNKMTKHAEELNNLNQNISALSHQMENLPPAPKIEPSDISHIKNANAATQTVREAKNNVDYANEHHQLASNLLPESDRQIAQHLNEGSDFPVNTSRQLRHEIESTNNHWSREYDNQMRDLRESNFQLLNPERAPQIQAALENARVQYGDDPHGDFGRVLRMAPDYSSMSAHDFMMDQKQFRNGIHNLYRQARYEGRNGNPVRSDELYRAARALQPFQDLVNQTLEEGLGEHAPRYHEIQEGYRTQVYPLRNNDVANKIMSGEPLSENIAGELAGDEEGQELLRGMANRNPEIRRNIVGQQYAKSHESVHNPNERLREYTNNMPELNRLTENRNRVQNSIEQSRNNITTAERQHEEAKIREQEAKAISKEAKENAKQLGEEYANKLAEIEKNKDNLQKDMTAHYEKIKQLQKQTPALQKHYDELKEKTKLASEAAKSARMNLKEKTKAQKALSIARQEEAEAKKQLAQQHFGYKSLINLVWRGIKKGKRLVY